MYSLKSFVFLLVLSTCFIVSGQDVFGKCPVNSSNGHDGYCDCNKDSVIVGNRCRRCAHLNDEGNCIFEEDGTVVLASDDLTDQAPEDDQYDREEYFWWEYIKYYSREVEIPLVANVYNLNTKNVNYVLITPFPSISRPVPVSPTFINSINQMTALTNVISCPSIGDIDNFRRKHADKIKYVREGIQRPRHITQPQRQPQPQPNVQHQGPIVDDFSSKVKPKNLQTQNRTRQNPNDWNPHPNLPLLPGTQGAQPYRRHH